MLHDKKLWSLVFSDNPIYQQKALPHEEDTPVWIHDPDIGHGKIRYINKEEKQFWKDLIRQYLYPLQEDKQKQKKMQADLLELRNKASLMFFMMNALFIIIIFSLQYSNAINIDSGLSIPLPCKDSSTGEPLSLEPISLFFMAVFGIALLIQFISMIFHRLGTFLHIMASTEVNCMKPNQNEVANMDITSKVQLVKEMQRFEDDDDTRSISTIGSDGEEDSSVTMDDSPKMKRRKTVFRLIRQRRRNGPQSGSLGGKFVKNFLELAKDLETDGSHKESFESNVRRRKSSKGSGKRSKKAQRAIELLQANKENKDSVLTKAEAIKDKWHRIARSAKGEVTGDKWGSLLRSVLGQSRTSLNTITEDDKRTSWFRSIGKMSRANSDLSLPDFGSISARNSYAEPILNMISDELEPEDINVKPVAPPTAPSVSSAAIKYETKAVIESKKSSKSENIYDTADFIPSEANSDSDTDSDSEGSPTDNDNTVVNMKSKTDKSAQITQMKEIRTSRRDSDVTDLRTGDTQL